MKKRFTWVSKGMVLTFGRPRAVTRHLAQVDTYLADP
jgi:hypothetical protein